MTVTHHNKVANHQQTHVELEHVNRHTCGKNTWAHKDDILWGNVPACSCECEQVSDRTEANIKLKQFLMAYHAGAEAEDAAATAGVKMHMMPVDRFEHNDGMLWGA